MAEVVEAKVTTIAVVIKGGKIEVESWGFTDGHLHRCLLERRRGECELQDARIDRDDGSSPPEPRRVFISHNGYTLWVAI